MKYLKVFESDNIKADKAKSIPLIYQSVRKYIDGIMDKMNLHEKKMEVSISDWDHPGEPFSHGINNVFDGNFDVDELLSNMEDDDLVDGGLSIDDLYIFFYMEISSQLTSTSPIFSNETKDMTITLKNNIESNKHFIEFCEILQNKKFRISELSQENGNLKIVVGYGLRNYFNKVTKIFKEL